MSEQSLARAVLAWIDVPLDQDGGTFVELEAMARAALSTPPADDVREALAAEARALIASRTDVEWAEFRIDLVRRLADAAEVRPRGKVTEDERAAINAALIRGLPLWVSAMDEGHARKALLEGIVGALEAAREAHP